MTTHPGPKSQLAVHLEACALCQRDQPCPTWDDLYRASTDGSDPHQSRLRMEEHLRECDRCAQDLPCSDWDLLYRAAGPMADPSAPPLPAAPAQDHDWSIGAILGGLALAAVGAAALLIPWIGTGSSTSTYSVELVQGVCSSALGQFAQLASGSSQVACSQVATIFFGAWAAIVIGAILFTVGIIAMIPRRA